MSAKHFEKGLGCHGISRNALQTGCERVDAKRRTTYAFAERTKTVEPRQGEEFVRRGRGKTLHVDAGQEEKRGGNGEVLTGIGEAGEKSRRKEGTHLRGRGGPRTEKTKRRFFKSWETQLQTNEGKWDLLKTKNSDRLKIEKKKTPLLISGGRRRGRLA